MRIGLTCSIPGDSTYCDSQAILALELTIVDDGDAGTLSISSPPVTLFEDEGSVALTLSRAGGSSGRISVAYATSDGSASGGMDFGNASGIVVLDDGESSATVTVAIVDDDEYEEDEHFYVSISSPTGGARLGSSVVAQVDVRDAPRAENSEMHSEMHSEMAVIGASVRVQRG